MARSQLAMKQDQTQSTYGVGPGHFSLHETALPTTSCKTVRADYESMMRDTKSAEQDFFASQ